MKRNIFAPPFKIHSKVALWLFNVKWHLQLKDFEWRPSKGKLYSTCVQATATSLSILHMLPIKKTFWRISQLIHLMVMEYYDFIHYTVKISTLNTFSFSEKKVEPKCLCMLHHCARGCGSYICLRRKVPPIPCW